MKSLFPVTPLTGVRRECVARALDMPDLVLPFWGYRKRMPMHHVVRLEGEGNYTILHFSDGSQLMISLTLKTMASRLSPGIFARSHKKNIINLLYLNGLHFDRQSLTVSLTNGDRVDVSRRKASDFVREVHGFQQQLEGLVTPLIVASA